MIRRNINEIKSFWIKIYDDKRLKTISLVSYSLIIFVGHMIWMPFLCWLTLSSIIVDNSDFIYSILGLLGFILMLTKFYNNRLIRIIAFLLLLTPLVKRLSAISLEKFNYLGFQIPFLIFMITSLVLIFKPKQEDKLKSKS